jgi:ferrous iron transport protein A
MSATLAAESAPHLALLKKGEVATVTGLADAVGAEQLAIKVRLLELGFAVGEKIRVVAESFPRRDPMAVRVGNTIFALRRAEAAMIQVTKDFTLA